MVSTCAVPLTPHPTPGHGETLREDQRLLLTTPPHKHTNEKRLRALPAPHPSPRSLPGTLPSWLSPTDEAQRRHAKTQTQTQTHRFLKKTKETGSIFPLLSVKKGDEGPYELNYPCPLVSVEAVSGIRWTLMGHSVRLSEASLCHYISLLRI